MPFLTMSNIDIDFQAWDLQWRPYITKDILPTTRQVEQIGRKEFTIAALNLEYEAFIVHVVALTVDLGDKVHPSKRAQIAHLKANKTFIIVPNKYANFANVISSKLAGELPKHTGINNYAI